MFIDFEQLKAATKYADVVSMLGLTLKQGNNQWRGACPFCKTGGDRALVITEGRGFYCFSAKRGGDQIALVAHIQNVEIKAAAQWIADRNSRVSSGNSTVGSSPEGARGEETKKFQPLAYLETDHPAVDAVGFDPAFAKKHGVGYASKGTMRGHVLIPFRDEDGTLLGYVGVTECRLPADFTPNVVSFPKTA